MIQWEFVCDAPDCGALERLAGTEVAPLPPGWVEVDEADRSLHFCGEDCAVRYGATLDGVIV